MNDLKTSRTALKYQNIFFCALLFGLALGTFAAPALAQTPSLSRGIQNLSISFDECKSRARRALEAEGYTIENGGGSFSGDYYFAGSKDIHNAVIACNSSSDGKTWANVFVASSNSNGGVPGAERVRLQARMDQSGAGTCGVLRILSAAYGGQGKSQDVTRLLQSHVRGGVLKMAVNNDSMGGDPIYGVVKSLYVKYECGGRVSEKTIDEGGSLSIP